MDTANDEKRYHFFWSSLNLLRSQVLTMLLRLMSVFISLRPCLNPNLFSSFSSFLNCSRSISSIQESSTTFAFSIATAITNFCFPSTGSKISYSSVSPVSQTLCMPDRPVILTSPCKMMKKEVCGSSIWQRMLLASFCLMLPIRSRHTPMTCCTFRKKGLNNYRDFIVFQSRQFVLEPFFKSAISYLNLQTFSFQSEESEFYLVALDYFQVQARTLILPCIDFYRFGTEIGMTNSGTFAKQLLSSFSGYQLTISFCVGCLLRLPSSPLFSTLLQRSSVIWRVCALLGALATCWVLMGSMVEVILAASRRFFLLVGLRQKELSMRLPLARLSSSVSPLRSSWAESVSQRAYLRLQDWSDGSTRYSQPQYSSRFRLSTPSISRMEGSLTGGLELATGGRISLLPPLYSSSLSIIILL